MQLQGQVDALVFAGGIGEKSAELRSAVLEKAECLGFKLDQAKNEKPTPGETAPANHEDDEGAKSAVTSIAPDHGKDGKETLVCWTDEQVRSIPLLPPLHVPSKPNPSQTPLSPLFQTDKA